MCFGFRFFTLGAALRPVANDALVVLRGFECCLVCPSSHSSLQKGAHEQGFETLQGIKTPNENKNTHESNLWSVSTLNFLSISVSSCAELVTSCTHGRLKEDMSSESQRRSENVKQKINTFLIECSSWFQSYEKKHSIISFQSTSSSREGSRDINRL